MTFRGRYGERVVCQTMPQDTIQSRIFCICLPLTSLPIRDLPTHQSLTPKPPTATLTDQQLKPTTNKHPTHVGSARRQDRTGNDQRHGMVCRHVSAAHAHGLGPSSIHPVLHCPRGAPARLYVHPSIHPHIHTSLPITQHPCLSAGPTTCLTGLLSPRPQGGIGHAGQRGSSHERVSHQAPPPLAPNWTQTLAVCVVG